MTENSFITESLPATAVIRVARGKFAPNLLAEVEAMNKKTSEYLIPAIRRLPGLIHFYAGVSPDGFVVNVSVWKSNKHAAQMDQLKEMAVDARGEAEAVGVEFLPPTVNYPVSWIV